MLNEFLQERAALYVSGAMLPQEREQFELVLEFSDELREQVAQLAEVATAITLATLRPGDFGPSPELKTRIFGVVGGRPQQRTSDGLVMSGPNGLVQWINPAFSAICGYTLEELRGKKLGPILQGENTNRQAAERLRRAVHEYRPCLEAILNYHKSGEPYWVEISLTPIMDGVGRPLWLFARERKLAGPSGHQPR
jgi:PAS domain S-box-containing protein